MKYLPIVLLAGFAPAHAQFYAPPGVELPAYVTTRQQTADEAIWLALLREHGGFIRIAPRRDGPPASVQTIRQNVRRESISEIDYEAFADQVRPGEYLEQMCVDPVMSASAGDGL